jgi:hypothetical protein
VKNIDEGGEQFCLPFTIGLKRRKLTALRSSDIEKNFGELSVEDLADISTELSDDIAQRIRNADEIRDVTTLNAIAEEIRDQSDSCIPLSNQIIQLAEDFNLDGIQKLADDLDSC